MVNAIDFYRGDAASGLDGSVGLWCSKARLGRCRQASRSMFGLSGARPYEFVICNLSLSYYVDC
jgi:hypothetical protein